MSRPPAEREIGQIPGILAQLLGTTEESLNVRKELNDCMADYHVKSGPHFFVIEYKAPGTPARISLAIQQALADADRHDANVIPTVATSYMGERGAELCRQSKVAWLDLAGNARIMAEGLNVNVSGKARTISRPGRRTNLFSPRSSNIARQLLLEPDRLFTQQELATQSGLDPGYTSRIVSRLEEEGLVTRDSTRQIRVAKPGLLLDTWRESYDFQNHSIIAGHVASRSGDSTQSQVSRALRGLSEKHAASGLGAAWLYNRFASFRMATIYLRRPPSKRLLDAVKVSRGPHGANLWLVIPRDFGVFDGSTNAGEIPVVSPLQTYLDLKGHPERASEAAAELKKTHLSWSLNG